MHYPKKITLPIELLQRIIVYNAFVVGVLKDLNKQDATPLDKPLEEVIETQMLSDLGIHPTDPLTLAHLLEDIQTLSQVLIQLIRVNTPPAQTVTQ